MRKTPNVKAKSNITLKIPVRRIDEFFPTALKVAGGHSPSMPSVPNV